MHESISHYNLIYKLLFSTLDDKEKLIYVIEIVVPTKLLLNKRYAKKFRYLHISHNFQEIFFF